MDINLSEELRRRFEIAWQMTPLSVRQDLEEFIRSVQSVESGIGAEIELSDGQIFTSSSEFGGWFVFDPTDEYLSCYIRIHQDFESLPEEFAVYTFLHELAHAVDYLEDPDAAHYRPTEKAEAAACAQVIVWAGQDPSEYSGARRVARIALNCAEVELGNWFLPKLDEVLEALSQTFYTT